MSTESFLRTARPASAFRGYRRDDVHRLLDEAASRIEALEGRLGTAEARAAEFVASGEELSRMLLSAQRTADETRAKAERDAEDTVERARREAERLSAEAHERLEAEIAKLESRRLAVVEELESLQRRVAATREELRDALRAALAVVEERLPSADQASDPQHV